MGTPGKCSSPGHMGSSLPLLFKPANPPNGNPVVKFDDGRPSAAPDIDSGDGTGKINLRSKEEKSGPEVVKHRNSGTFLPGNRCFFRRGALH